MQAGNIAKKYHHTFQSNMAARDMMVKPVVERSPHATMK
jgi:hypothetical protein